MLKPKKGGFVSVFGLGSIGSSLQAATQDITTSYESSPVADTLTTESISDNIA